MKYIVAFLFLTSLSWAQLYEPIDTTDNVLRKEAALAFEQRQEKFIDLISSRYSKTVKKEFEYRLEDFQEEFSNQIEEGKFIYDERFLNKISAILTEIKEANPSYQINTAFLIAKETGLNAFCLYDGTMVINLGTFYYLENEDELAGVICHEIAHYILEHAIKGQLRSIQLEDKDKKNKTVKNLKKQKYNLSEKAFGLFKERLYDAGKLNRKHEYEADSLGFVLFKNTKYKTADFVNSFKLIELYDTIKPTGLALETYKKLYAVEGIPFQEKWLEKEDFSSYDYSKYKEKFEEDSLKTHPEAENRIKNLKRIFPENNHVSEPSEPTDEYKDLSDLAYNEMVPSLYFTKDYGRAIYVSMLRIQKGKDAAFYKQWLGKCFQKVYEARKDYRLNRYLDRIVPKEHEESYQQFLSFMWNLNLDEIKSIADYYAQSEV